MCVCVCVVLREIPRSVCVVRGILRSVCVVRGIPRSVCALNTNSIGALTGFREGGLGGAGATKRIQPQ